MKNTIKKFISIVLVFVMCMICAPFNSAYAASDMQIPDDAVEFNEHYYKIYQLNLNWLEAKEYCENLGGHLVTITTQTEQTYIESLISQHSKATFWIGLTDRESEGDWSKWITGEKVEFTNWGNNTADDYDEIQDAACIVNFKKTGDTWEINFGQWDDVEETTLNGSSIYYFICEWDNIYNLGEETYGFKNYTDSDSKNGHCFGMSVTSSGYYMGTLPLPFGINSAKDLNKYALSGGLKEPICYYQEIQGSVRDSAIVAGNNGIETDWNEILNYINDHKYDGKGNLVIIYGVYNEGLHAVNFLRYEVVDDQERVYVYDSNYPTKETYFYQDENNDIRQAVFSTFTEAIDGMVLMSATAYLVNVSAEENIKKYKRMAIYSDASIVVENAIRYEMCGDYEANRYYVHELPEDTTTVKITPLVDNATFTYMGQEYSFGEIGEETYAELTLSATDDDVPELEIINSTDDEPNDPDAGNEPNIEPTPVELPKINNTTTTTINYGDTLVLQLKEIEIPEGYAVKWFVEGAGVSTKVNADGTECRVTSIANGNATIYAKLVDADENVVTNADGEEIFDEITLTSKAGFWQKFVSFFKNLFGSNRVIY